MSLKKKSETRRRGRGLPCSTLSKRRLCLVYRPVSQNRPLAKHETPFTVFNIQMWYSPCVVGPALIADVLQFFSFLFHRSADASSILELWESLELPCPPRLLEVSLESQILLSLFLCVRPPPSLFPPPPFRVKSIFPSFPPFIGSPDPSRRRGRQMPHLAAPWVLSLFPIMLRKSTDSDVLYDCGGMSTS